MDESSDDDCSEAIRFGLGDGIDAIDVGVLFGLAGWLLDEHAGRVAAEHRPHTEPLRPTPGAGDPSEVNAADRGAGASRNLFAHRYQFVGQPHIKETVRAHIERKLWSGLHFGDLLITSSDRGMGKTSLAMLIAAEWGSNLRLLRPPYGLTGLHDVLSGLEEGDFLVIEDFNEFREHQHLLLELQRVLEQGWFQHEIGRISIEPFSLIAEATLGGPESADYIDDFSFHLHLESYNYVDLLRLSGQLERRLGFRLSSRARSDLINGSTGTPRDLEELVLLAHHIAQRRSTAEERGAGVLGPSAPVSGGEVLREMGRPLPGPEKEIPPCAWQPTIGSGFHRGDDGRG